MTKSTFMFMCEEAKEELSRYWEPKPGDLIFNALHDDALIWVVDYEDKFGDVWLNRMVWTPRQKDIQQIIKEINPRCFDEACLDVEINLIYFLYHWGSDLMIGNPDYYELIMYDLDIQWLCFMMDVCFSKVWDGKTWVKK